MSQTLGQPSAQEVKLRYDSHPLNRPGLGVMVGVYSITWILTAALVVLATVGAFRHSPYQMVSSVFAIAGVALVIYLAATTKRLFSDFRESYVFELTDDEARLRTVDNKTKESILKRVPFRDVTFVEYFTPLGEEALVFHGINGRLMEVPLYSMTRDPSAILKFLQGKNIKIERI
jgi:hypothetical protein